MRKRSRLLRFGLFLLSTWTIKMASANIALGQGEHTMKIRFVFDDRTVTATLNDSPLTQDFLRQLPLTIELEDFARTEKIADLPRKLTTQGAPSGTASKAGDIAYYAPWGNLVIFYKDFGYASGLIHLGQLDGGLDRLTSNGSMRITIERAD